jgi:hypothetical protein
VLAKDQPISLPGRLQVRQPARTDAMTTTGLAQRLGVAP